MHTPEPVSIGEQRGYGSSCGSRVNLCSWARVGLFQWLPGLLHRRTFAKAQTRRYHCHIQCQSPSFSGCRCASIPSLDASCSLSSVRSGTPVPRSSKVAGEGGMTVASPKSTGGLRGFRLSRRQNGGDFEELAVELSVLGIEEDVDDPVAGSSTPTAGR
jgi:hypothetical protein